jgi:DNA-binding NarL/FixJ family response regulator
MSSTPESTPRRMLIVEDHPMFREHLALLITQELPITICGEADNIKDAMMLLEREKPDIAIIDLTLRGGSSGLELIKDIKAMDLDVRILVLSMHDEDLYAERAIRAGARGYITKNEATPELIKAIQCVVSGGIYASPRLTTRVLSRYGQKRAATSLDGIESLADRELEVFQMLGRGKSVPEISKTLNLGESTVETYRSRIREKLKLRSAAELYLRAGQWVRDYGA